jgi:hypothetical protein
MEANFSKPVAISLELEAVAAPRAVITSAKCSRLPLPSAKLFQIAVN